MILTSPLSMAIFVTLLGAVAHAFFNIILKKGTDKLTLRTMTTWCAALYFLPLTIIMPLPSQEGFYTLCISAVIHFIYHLCQIKSLEHIDVSMSYPLSRGSAPFFIALGSMFFLGETLSFFIILGIGLISLSVLYMLEFQKIKTVPHLGSGIIWSLLTGLCIGVYTLIDSSGARAEDNFLSFVAWFFLFDGFGTTLLFFVRRRGKIIKSVKQEYKYAFASGAFCAIAYGLIMYGFVLAEGHTTMIAGIRETSIIFGMMLAYLILKEHISKKRALAGLGIFLGAVILRLG